MSDKVALLIENEQLRARVAELETKVELIHVDGAPYHAGAVRSLLNRIAELEQQPRAVPAGYAIVPVEATQAMLDAGYYPCVQNRGAKSVGQARALAAQQQGGRGDE